MNNSSDSILEVRNLKTYFRTSEGIGRAVDGVSFTIHCGETLALAGESGCGKSMTALSIMQLVPEPSGFIESGQVLLNGKNIIDIPEREKREIRGNRIAMIFQDPMTSLNPVLTVGYQVAEAIRLHQKVSWKTARQRTVDMFKRVGIPDADQRYRQYPHQMSGGMKQRVMIAMALSCQPDVLIADEPTTALDVTIQAQILDLMRELQRQMSMAILLITHDLGVAHEMADNVCIMYAGQIVERASKEDLFKQPQHPYTIKLFDSLPSRQKRGTLLSTIRGAVPPATRYPEGCRFVDRCPEAMDACREKSPAEIKLADGRTVRCHLFDKTFRSKKTPQPQAVETIPSVGPSENGAPLVTVRDLRVHFPILKGILRRVKGYIHAVDGIDLDIPRGKTLALVGESGCGKTTTGLAILNLVREANGNVLFDGINILGMGGRAMRALRRRMQIIFQDPFASLNPRMTVGQIVGEGLPVHKLARTRQEREEKILEALKAVGLDESAIHSYPHEFSGGQRQRICIARALVLRPDFIVCDEATSALDVPVQAQILNLLRRLQVEYNLTYLFITHNLGVVEYLADEVAVMYLGRIVERAKTADLFDNPSHPYTRALLSAIPQIDSETGRRRIKLGGDVPSPVNPPEGCHFHPRCPIYAGVEPAPERFENRLDDLRELCCTTYPKPHKLSDNHTCACHLYSANL